MSEATASELRITHLDRVTPERVHWLWQGRIALGKLNLLDGDPGQGKTTLLLDIAARLTSGRPMPDGTPCGAEGGVVILTAEDGIGDTIVPRLVAAGADRSKCVTASLRDAGDEAEYPLSIPANITDLELTITHIAGKLVMIDPLMAFLGGEVKANNDQDVRRALARLASLAERTGAAVCVIRHLNKMPGSNPLYRGGGSIGILGAARVALLVAPDPDDDTRHILAVNKCNLAAPALALAYCLEETDLGVSRVAWKGQTGHTARSLLAPPLAEEAEVGGALADAKQFLRDILAAGPKPVNDIRAEAKAAGISDRTLDRAKERLPVHSKKHGQGPWTWELTEKDAKDAKDANSATVEEHGVLRPEGKNANGSYHGSLGALGALGAVPPNGHAACRLCGAPATHTNPTGRHCRQHALHEPGGLTELLAGAERDTLMIVRPGAGEGSAR